MSAPWEVYVVGFPPEVHATRLAAEIAYRRLRRQDRRASAPAGAAVYQPAIQPAHVVIARLAPRSPEGVPGVSPWLRRGAEG